MNATALNFVLLPEHWQTHGLRALMELVLLAGLAVLILLILHTRRHHAREKLQARQQAEQALNTEHASRLQAEQSSSSLSQRLLTAHEDERRHLARELHDDLTQRLARLAIDAAQAERGKPAAPDSGTWRHMREELVKLCKDVHGLAHSLHPAVLDELGLAEAIRAECARFTRLYAVPVKVRTHNLPGKIFAPAALCLFRITQESLRNVGRHAQATDVEVSLAMTDDGLQLSVHDNGIGFNPEQTREHASLGIASVKERIKLVSGKLEIESQPGCGTTVLTWVPLKEALKT